MANDDDDKDNDEQPKVVTTKENRKNAMKMNKRRKLSHRDDTDTDINGNGGTSDDRRHQNDDPANPKIAAATPVTPPPNQNESRMEALRRKLQWAIANKQQQQQPSSSNSSNSNSEQISKRAARRAAKLQRQTMAAQQQKQKSTTSKAPVATKYTIPTATTTTATDPSLDLQQIDYGRIVGLDSNNNIHNNHHTKESHDALRRISQNKNQSLTKMIADAEKKKALLVQLTKSPEPDAPSKLATIHWKDTFQEANGVRIKDNVTKLHRQQKRVVQKKKKSQKQWSSRLEQLQTSTTERQNIRSHNLQRRMVGGTTGANLSRKEIQSKTTTPPPRRRAGFEGRTATPFLNHAPSSKTTTHPHQT